MVGWHHQLNGHGFEQTSGDSEGQGNPSTELEYSYLIPGFDDRCACSNLLDGPQVQNSFKGFQMWGNLRKSNDLLKRNKKTTSIDCDFLTVCSVQFSHSVVSNSL